MFKTLDSHTGYERIPHFTYFSYQCHSINIFQLKKCRFLILIYNYKIPILFPLSDLDQTVTDIPNTYMRGIPTAWS